jgi:hypothetical protein
VCSSDLPPPFAAKAAAGVASDSATDNEAEAEFWEGVRDSDDPDDLELYLEQFPRGKYAAEARAKVAELRGK